MYSAISLLGWEGAKLPARLYDGKNLTKEGWIKPPKEPIEYPELAPRDPAEREDCLFLDVWVDKEVFDNKSDEPVQGEGGESYCCMSMSGYVSKSWQHLSSCGFLGEDTASDTKIKAPNDTTD